MLGSFARKFVQGHDVSQKHADNIVRVCCRFELLGVTDPENQVGKINDLLRDLKSESVLSLQTVKNYRSIICAVLRFSLSASVADEVIKIKVPLKPTRAFQLNEILQALQTLSSKKDKYFRNTGFSQKLWMKTFIHLSYETAFRWGDAYHLSQEDVTCRGVQITCRKTGQPITLKLSDKTLELIEQNYQPKGLGIFDWHLKADKNAHDKMTEWYKSIGFKIGRSQWLRRSAATHVEKKQPGQAAKLLGHKTPGLAEKSYIDYSQLEPQIVQPDSLHDL